MVNKELLERVRSLIQRAQDQSFVVAEDTGMFSLEEDLVRRVLELLADATTLLREAMDIYDARSAEDAALANTGPSSESDILRVIGAQISSELAAREVSDLAFVARGQLLDVRDSLERALASRSIWKIASHADAGLRRCGRALIALESAILEYDGQESPQRRWIDIDDSLEIRRLYGQFRRAILRGGEPTGPELRAQLRKAANRISILRDLKIYPYLRIDDRLQIRRMQKRIRAWLRLDEASSEEEGRRLWADLVAFARLLAQINNRQELREHDEWITKRIYNRLFDSYGPRQNAVVDQSELEPLLGRDDDLDDVILHFQGHNVDDLRDPMERLLKDLDRYTSHKIPTTEVSS